jgi:DNA repair exonuclease SbcCD ATPase subunit
MLPPKLQEILDRLQAKALSQMTDKEKELLRELRELDQFLTRKNESAELRESVRKNSQITSGPSGACPCCGR